MDLDRMFNDMAIRADWLDRAESACSLVEKSKERYQVVADAFRVPWYFVGIVHLMEGSCNFKTHLHNGDSLLKRTVNVPAGHPKQGNPPFTWEVSAIDALDLEEVEGPFASTGAMLDKIERFNGLGYRKKGIPSPYLWSGSNYYWRGKYVADGKFDPNAVSKQVGAAVVLKLILEQYH